MARYTIFDSGEPDMDFTRRAMLNDFGLVQHAVFERHQLLIKLDPASK